MHHALLGPVIVLSLSWNLLPILGLSPLLLILASLLLSCPSLVSILSLVEIGFSPPLVVKFFSSLSNLPTFSTVNS